MPFLQSTNVGAQNSLKGTVAGAGKKRRRRDKNLDVIINGITKDGKEKKRAPLHKCMFLYTTQVQELKIKEKKELLHTNAEMRCMANYISPLHPFLFFKNRLFFLCLLFCI